MTAYLHSQKDQFNLAQSELSHHVIADQKKGIQVVFHVYSDHILICGYKIISTGRYYMTMHNYTTLEDARDTYKYLMNHPDDNYGAVEHLDMTV